MVKPKTLVVNLFGGPGTGKSTNMAGLFHLLKLNDIDSEIVPEYAKDKVWEESYRVLSNQIYVFGKQYHRLFRVLDKVDVVVTDSPILLSAYYDTHYEPETAFTTFPALILEAHDRMNTLNVFLIRKKKYNPNGRYQTEEQAIDIDHDVKALLDRMGVLYVEVVADHTAPEVIYNLVQRRLKEGSC